MRVVICGVVFVALLLVGFLATPGIFKIVNPDYWLALREYGEPLAKAAKDLSDIDAQLADYQSRISKLERSIKDTSAEYGAEAARLQTANASDAEKTNAGIQAAAKANSLSNELNQIGSERKDLTEKKASVEASRAELKKKLDASASESVNIYIVTRALALGAIGAMISIFAKFLVLGSPHFLFEDRMIMSRMWASMVMGGTVAVVVIGLFLTGFISIFSNAAQNTGPTDYWKVTILCLFAGAFSDRLFQAAAGRMDNYLRTAGKNGRSRRSTRGLRSVKAKSKR